MWTFTQHGFASAVAHRDQPDTIIVRFRDERDAEAHAKAIGVFDDPPDVQTTPVADYAYRIEVSRATWAAFISQESASLDYDNFKSMMAHRCPHWGRELHEIWHVHHDHQVKRRVRRWLNHGEIDRSTSGTGIRRQWGNYETSYEAGDTLRSGGFEVEFLGIQLTTVGAAAVFEFDRERFDMDLPTTNAQLSARLLAIRKQKRLTGRERAS